jgi:endonuclease/exonuclease/phosphatase family metal-dependent hydrolase
VSPLFEDPLAPFGPLSNTTLRVVTWNVWSRFGPWHARYERVRAELIAHEPDVVALQEVWRTDEHDVVAELAEALGFHVTAALEFYEPLAEVSGSAVLSRWPVLHTEFFRALSTPKSPGALVQWVRVDGPRGVFDMFTVMLDWRPDWSEVRQDQVRELASFVRERGTRDGVVIVCGDFNAVPESDEIRALKGFSGAAARGLVVLDAWETAGDGSLGHTWSNANPWAAVALLPDRRIDYIFTAWPRPNGAGHPVRCELIGTEPGPDGLPSDHYGVLADVRY